MSRKDQFFFESFVTLVALERSLHCMRRHVLLQMTRSCARVVALVTFERLLSCMLPYVNFQVTICDAGILARCASFLFSLVHLLVPLQWR